MKKKKIQIRTNFKICVSTGQNINLPVCFADLSKININFNFNCNSGCNCPCNGGSDNNDTYKCPYDNGPAPPLFREFENVKLHPSANPVWEVRNNGTEIAQLANADSSVSVGPDNYGPVDYSGIVRVDTLEDDDYIGFVFAYQSNKLFYTIMWKKGTQGKGKIGVQLKLVNSTTGPSAALSDALWDTADTPNQVKLLWVDPNPKGWKSFTKYTFNILHRPKIGLIRVSIYDGSNLIVDSGNVYDSTLKGGRLGVFDSSQKDVVWSDLSVKCNEKVPQNVYDDLPPNLEDEVEVEDNVYKCPYDYGSAPPVFRKFENVKFDPASSPVWEVRKDGTEIAQLANANTAASIGPDEYGPIDYSGIVRVDTNFDDDYIGFIFAYQSNKTFYVIMWKKGNQGTNKLGVQLKLANSTTGPGAAFAAALGTDGDTPNEVKSLWVDPTPVGWKAFTNYTFKILHRPKIGLIRVGIYEKGNLIIDTGNVIDATLKGGRLGVYDHSQTDAVWTDLTVKCNEKVPQNVYDELPPNLQDEVEIEYKCPYDESSAALPVYDSYESVLLDPESKPEWQVRNNGSEIELIPDVNAVASIGPNSYGSVNYSGIVTVETKEDDDYIGFVFAYQSNKSFYVVMWKKGAQNWNGARAEVGIQLKLVNSTTGPSTALSKALWHTGDTANQVKLLWKSSPVGWQPSTPYTFRILHKADIGQIQITVLGENNVIADSGTIADSTLKGGRVGVFDHSQAKTVWSGLSATCIDEN